jgi:hypothetical protein
MSHRSHVQSPDAGYFLRTQRLGFRTWTEAHLELAFGLWGDAEVTRLIGGPFSLEQVQRRLAQEIANQTAYGIQYWPVFLVIHERIFAQDIAAVIVKIDISDRSGVASESYLREMKRGEWDDWRTPR